MELFNIISSRFQASETRTDNGSLYYTPKESLSKRVQRRKLNKLEIGSPTNFQHVTHVGFNAVPGLDATSERDLKKLLNMASIEEEHLEDQEVPHTISSVLEKAGGMEAVRKQARRMTSVERSSAPTRLRTLSSSSLAPSKRQSCLEQDSPHAAKISAILARGSPFCYLPTQSKVPPPMETLPPIHFPPMKPPPPMPPYLAELSQSFSPEINSHVGYRLKKRSNTLQPLSAKNSGKTLPPLLPVAQGVCSETRNLPLSQSTTDYCPGSTMNRVSPTPLSHLDNSSATNCIPAHFPLSVSCTEPLIKLGDVQSLPQSVRLHPEITMCNPKGQLNVGLMSVPSPPPPPVEFKKRSSKNPLFNGSELSCTSQVKKTNNSASKIHAVMVSSEEFEQQTNSVFLDQIKQGVQLKSVSQTVKVEDKESADIVSVLRDVIKKRHKAIQSSDEDEEDDWED